MRAIYQDRLFINDGKGNFTIANDALPKMYSPKSAVAVADFNMDGKPDIFVGGRLIPGSYGKTPTSYLLQNQSIDGKIKFVNVIATVAPALEKAGMITAANWTDVNSDNLPDLLIAGEWMPLKLFINRSNKLEDKSASSGLQHSNGLWTCMEPMDIDKDGDEDFLLGNLAPNTQLSASVNEPITLYVNDFNGSGSTQPILGYYIQGKSYPYPSRNELLEEMPLLRKKFFYYKDYATAGFNDIITTEQRKGLLELKAYQLKNCWLENKGDGYFELHELPIQSQFSTIQGAVMVDVDKYGGKELFAAGNFYPFNIQLGREDAGKGVLLKWDAYKKSVVPSGLNLGIYADGDIRDVLSLKSANGNQTIVISRNNDSVQVLQPNR